MLRSGIGAGMFALVMATACSAAAVPRGGGGFGGHSAHFAASPHNGARLAPQARGSARSIRSQGYRASRLGREPDHRPNHRVAARSRAHRTASTVANRAAATPSRHRIADGSTTTKRSRGGYVGWRGQTFWPEAYRDIHGWTLWPQDYSRGFWSFAYDDVFAGTLWPPGSPASGTVGRLNSSGDRSDRSDSSTLSPELSRICGGHAELAAWPFDRIRESVEPTETQQVLLDKLREASRQAADTLQAGCSTELPTTATGRLDAIAHRLHAMLDAVAIVRRAFDPFYRSLTGEQRARLDRTVVPSRSVETVPSTGSASCSDERAPGFRERTIRHIDRVVGPDAVQRAALDELRLASSKAAKMLRAPCSRAVPSTPTARLEAAEGRLAAMLRATKALSPALTKFYDSLNAEQKVRFNSMRAARNG